MRNIGQRIKELRKMLGLSQREFAEKIGKSLRAVQNWEYEQRTPDESTLKLIAKEFNVNEEWLKTGEGEMFVEAVAEKEYIEIPLYDIYASAGEGIENYETAPKPFKLDEEFAKLTLGINSTKGLFIIQAYGNSMYPTIKSGDLLIGKFFEYEGFLLEGSVYVFRIGNELFIKRFKRDSKSNKLIFKPDNPEYDDIEITDENKGKLKIIGRILRNFANI